MGNRAWKGGDTKHEALSQQALTCNQSVELLHIACNRVLIRISVRGESDMLRMQTGKNSKYVSDVHEELEMTWYQPCTPQ